MHAGKEKAASPGKRKTGQEKHGSNSPWITGRKGIVGYN
jgi:hypothetical protein